MRRNHLGHSVTQQAPASYPAFAWKFTQYLTIIVFPVVQNLPEPGSQIPEWLRGPNHAPTFKLQFLIKLQVEPIPVISEQRPEA